MKRNIAQDITVSTEGLPFPPPEKVVDDFKAAALEAVKVKGYTPLEVRGPVHFQRMIWDYDTDPPTCLGVEPAMSLMVICAETEPA